MPRKKKKNRLREYSEKTLGEPLLTDILIIIIMVCGLYFGVKGALILGLQTESPMMAVSSNSMLHSGENTWNSYSYYVNEGYDPATFPIPDGFKEGDLIVLRGPQGKDSIVVGDVIVFEQGDRAIVHRVAMVENDGYRTRGDANSSLDQPIGPGTSPPLAYESVIGEVLMVIPDFGHLSLWFTPQLLATIVAVILAVAAAIVTIASILRERS